MENCFLNGSWRQWQRITEWVISDWVITEWSRMLSLGGGVETVAENAMLGLTRDVKMQEGMKTPRTSNRALVGMDIEFDGYGMMFVKTRSIRRIKERVGWGGKGCFGAEAVDAEVAFFPPWHLG